MGHSPLRRELLVALPASILAACARAEAPKARPTPMTRSELEARGLIPASPTSTPDPLARFTRIDASRELIDSNEWDVTYEDPRGFFVRALTESKRGIGTDGVFQVGFYNSALRQIANTQIRYDLLLDPQEDLSLDISTKSTDPQTRFHQFTVNLRSTRPRPSISLTANVVDAFAPFDVWVAQARYRDKLIQGNGMFIGAHVSR